MASQTPWYEDADCPGCLAHMLGIRNQRLYGLLRAVPNWMSRILPPSSWRFAADPEVDGLLRETWALVAETHFVYRVLEMLPDDALVNDARSSLAPHRDQTAAIVAEVIGRLRGFVRRYPELEVQMEHFECDWNNLWVDIKPGEIRYPAEGAGPNAEPAHGADDEADFQRRKQAIMDAIVNEIQNGIRFVLTADQVLVGMPVCSVGGEFHPQPWHKIIRVVAWDPNRQIAICENQAGETREVPLANLRDVEASIREADAQVIELMIEMGRVSLFPGELIIRPGPVTGPSPN